MTSRRLPSPRHQAGYDFGISDTAIAGDLRSSAVAVLVRSLPLHDAGMMSGEMPPSGFGISFAYVRDWGASYIATPQR